MTEKEEYILREIHMNLFCRGMLKLIRQEIDKQEQVAKKES